jgi:hypothetical protein
MVDSRAFSEQVGTLSVSRAAAGALASFEVVDEGKITAADGTIHAAGGDEVGRNRVHFPRTSRKVLGISDELPFPGMNAMPAMDAPEYFPAESATRKTWRCLP